MKSHVLGEGVGERDLNFIHNKVGQLGSTVAADEGSENQALYAEV